MDRNLLKNVQERSFSSQVTLSDLRDNPGARPSKKRLGRGTGSGLGKTSGRGHKGQRARAGNHGLLGFEGGQTPLMKKLPKFGHKNVHAYISLLEGLNIDRLWSWIQQGRIDSSKLINMKVLRDTGCVGSNIKKGIKLLAKGKELTKIDRPLQIEVSDASAQAKRIIEEAGGKVIIAYYNRLGLRAMLKPEKFERIPRRAAPPPKLMWKYPLHYKQVQEQMLQKQ
ncbi:hypothetical protein GUITHDRAFT_101888 [Guillardia theta CCMP2712]|uniref:Large ribosomal subunit protein uL15/eL18 domain-containing protein n=2 Tax=Guillardia theta TaxID=55529 RepID=L1JWK2_GUITC|nr:hypothetical protein GUITHDRAFT_101888 [Guillardia theta CCMP2712]EKX52737.1 hypothetical protein GUITHDRAFT_101888 [Guillardia theta CCMP2712]|eukprot:XP_005839717.1 hypothetical protein GUITHDRAFT_101888 [Guillardia theta CCMP2712]